MKVKIKKAVLAEKIYIKKEDVEDANALIAAYTINNGDEFISCIEETSEYYLVPSNSYYMLEWDSIEDRRNYQKLEYQIEFSGSLRPEQQQAVDAFFLGDRARSGLLQAPPGFGKTFAACNLIARNNTKTLVLVHSTLLFEQWLAEIHQQLPNCRVGQIGDGFFNIGDVTIAIYKSVYNKLDILSDEFSLLITDECHKAPAEMFSEVVNNINARVKIGLSATPRRKDGKHIFLPYFFSTHKVTARDSRNLAIPTVTIKQTDFKFKVLDPKRDWTRAINTLCSDTSYQQLIVNTAIAYIKQGRCPLIIGDRVQMLVDIQKLIPDSICVIGSTNKADREKALEELGTTYKAILTTKLFDEGISCHRLDTLFFTCPSNNPVQWEQRIGRIERLHPDKQFPLIVDFWLSGKVVERQQTTRHSWYKSRGYNFI